MSAVIERPETAVIPAETSILSVIERAATNPEVDIEKMERLLQMHERILNRDAEVAFSADFAQMQAELPMITENGQIKDSQGNVRNHYALFEDINEAVRPILKAHGFGMTFRSNIGEGGVSVTGILMHRQGHREETTIKLPVDTSGSKNAVQAIGSSVSYGKRYTMLALLNITTGGEDDDGEASGPRPMKIDDRPDTRHVDTKTANAYAKRIIDAINSDNARTAADLKAELSQDDALFTVVWGMLAKPLKDKFEDLIDREIGRRR